MGQILYSPCGIAIAFRNLKVPANFSDKTNIECTYNNNVSRDRTQENIIHYNELLTLKTYPYENINYNNLGRNNKKLYLCAV
jgi:hypothetical protein